jgi:hypothetical protein
MKNSALTYSFWGLSVLGAFAVGYYIAKSPGDASPGTAERRLVNGQSVYGGARIGSGTSTAAARPDGETAQEKGRDDAVRPLNQAQIDDLAREAFTDPNPLTRKLAFSKMLASLTPENAAMMMAAMKANRADGQQWNLFHYAWGSKDPAGAFAFAETLNGGQKSQFLTQALPGWASKDPNGAIAWLEGLKDGDEKNRFRSSLVGGLADHDINAATAYVMQRVAANDKQAGEFLQTVTGEALRKMGPEGAAAWGDGLAEGPLKGGALDQIADSFAERDPKAAAAWATKYATGEYATRVIEEVGDNWAERDPRAALAWLGSLQDGKGRSEGTYSALREWTQRDPMAASKYLSAMPASPSKDYAVSGFANSLAREDPESAVIWAKTITNDDARTSTLKRTGQYWFRRDPKAAQNWLQSSNLPPALQEAIRNPPPDDKRRG